MVSRLRRTGDSWCEAKKPPGKAAAARIGCPTGMIDVYANFDASVSLLLHGPIGSQGGEDRLQRLGELLPCDQRRSGISGHLRCGTAHHSLRIRWRTESV